MADSMEKRQRERKKREKAQLKAQRKQERALTGGQPIADEDAPSRFDLLPEYSSADEPTEITGRYRTPASGAPDPAREE